MCIIRSSGDLTLERTENIRTINCTRDNRLVDDNGKPITPPEGWAFLPAGDAGLTRKVTAKKQYWKVVFRKGRRVMSKGVWAPCDIIEKAKADVAAVRSTDQYKKKLEAGRKYRAKKEEEYVADFFAAVKKSLSFHVRFREMEEALARAVTEHAIPVGSGTVARTAMIPIEERASRAVIAWMRHQTTAYDNMHIPRVKGMRRETRRLLAQRSSELLARYRRGENPGAACPLLKALEKLNSLSTKPGGFVD